MLAIAVGVVGLFLLAWPASSVDPGHAPVTGGTFAWDRDAAWSALEGAFVAARRSGCADTAGSRRALDALHDSVVALGGAERVAPESPRLDALEAALFATGATVAACPARLADYVAITATLRQTVKQVSREWDVQSRPARDRLYRALYGSRAAVEEVLLQHPDTAFALQRGVDEPSAAPAATVRGVVLHSGDMLVSRGGYPTSALIARGNDYPGNFSHVALVHVDSATHAVSVIEAHIERGVAVATAEAYLADKKLRLLVLRPRADLPQLVADPLLPHRAATAMLARATGEHIPYDFAMDYRDPSRLFCSEVASAAYRARGLDLWTGISTITGEGLRRWLGGFGVEHFETQEPSDLEYDPQLVVVAEWRDPVALRRDHIDNAVTDAMLEGAERGDEIGFAWVELPAARLAKAYSWLRERSGGIGPIPEGMSAAAALRNRAYSERHAALAATADAAATAWQAEHGYPPPYWVMVALARQAVADAT
jgi:hypothetical protein